MNDLDNLAELIKTKAKLAAMLAPSFPIVFSQQEIVGKLKRIGFTKVVEVGLGAQETNRQVITELEQNPQKKIITSPCPSLSRLVKTKFPHLLPFLSFRLDSPMSATAKIVKQKFSDHKPVFIGPCHVKKLEAKEDWPELNILAITFTELQEIFQSLNLNDDPQDKYANFDLSCSKTRLYPISGGLTQSSEVKEILSEDQIQVVSGWKNSIAALNDFPNNNVRLLDILFCEGGCINGPGIKSELDLSQRREKIINYWLN